MVFLGIAEPALKQRELDI
jgi:hypothetical protein